METIKIAGKVVSPTKAEVLVSGPKANEGGKVAIGHVALAIDKYVFEVGRYAGTYRAQFRDASPEGMRDMVGQVGWTFGDAILLMRDKNKYLKEERRSRNVRGYVMQANTNEITSMLKYIKERSEESTNVNKEAKTSADKRYRYLASVLRSDPGATAYQLPESYKIVGNSCVDFVGEALDTAYWVWDFDNMFNLSPSDLSRKLELNSKYSTSKVTYKYNGNGKAPGWWFEIKDGDNTILKDGPSMDTTVGDLIDSME